MRNLKSALSLFVTILLIASMLCTSVFAAKVYNGDTELELDGVAVEQNGYGGKATDDSYYAVTAVSTNFQTGFYPLGAGNTLELQFALADDSSVFVAYPRMYREADKTASVAVSYHRLEVDSAGMRYYGGDYSAGSKTMLWSEKVDIIPGRWYSLVAKFQDDSASDGQREQEFYLNGNLVHKGNGLTDFGYRNLAAGAKNAEHGVYLDNIIQSNNRGVSSEETHVIDINRMKSSALTAVGAYAEVNEDLGAVMALAGTTVGELKNGISSENTDDVINVYNADLTALASDDDEAIGKVIIISSKNGTDTEQAYKYYDVIGLDYDEEFGRGKNASDLVLEEGATAESVPGVFGKDASDDVYKIVRTSGKGIHLAKTFNNGALTLGSAWGHFEFSFVIGEGDKLSLDLQYFTTTDKAYIPLNIQIGQLTSGSGSNPVKIADCPIKANQWHTFAITIPTDGAEDGVAKLYIDGNFVKGVSASSAKGFRQPFVGFAGASEASPIYIDNISMTKTTSYDAAKNVRSALASVGDVATLDETNSAVVANFGSTVADVYAATEAANADDIVRIYEADFSALADENDDTNDKVIVVASKNGTRMEQAFRYYALSEFDLDAEKCRGKYVSDLVLADGTTAESIPGNFGKLPTDDVYKLNKQSGDGIVLPNTITGSTTFPQSQNYGRIDFDFAIDSGAMASVRVAYWTGDTTHSSQQINFEVGQTTSGSSLTGDPYSADIKEGTWYSVTITCPTAENDNEGKVKIYVNGKLLRELGAKGALGMRRPFIIPNKSNGTASVYVDNISVSKGNSNDVDKDVPSILNVNKGVAYKGKISYIETPDASDFSSADANTVIRFFDADWNQVNEVSGAKYVVTAIKDEKGIENVWDYYTIDANAKQAVVAGYNYNGEYLVKAYSSGAGNKLYVAEYEYIYEDKVHVGTKLAGIKLVNTDANGKAEIKGEAGDYVYRALLWNSDEAPLTGRASFEYKK